MTELLQLQGIRAGFGAQTVLHGIDLTVPQGRVTGIFGLNGAGKSVLLKVVGGLVPVWSGTITMLGRDITSLLPEQRVMLGMANVPQGRQMFGSLSVEENLRVGAYPLRRKNKAAYDDALARIFELFPLLKDRRTQAAGTLSGGQQATLAIGRALISDPAVVLIDEPTAGLAPTVVEELLDTLLVIRETGITLLLVEQNIRFGLRLADDAVLLQRGRIAYSGEVSTLDQDTLADYLGVGRLLRRDLDAGLDRGAAAKARPRRTGMASQADRKPITVTSKRATRRTTEEGQ